MTKPSENISYRDIKKIALDRIRNGFWQPDTILPNEAELAEEFSTTRTTVNRAMRELAEEGFIERKRKAGTRVLNSPTRHARFAIPRVKDEVNKTGASYRYSLISAQTRLAPEWLAAKLDLGAGQHVIHVRSMHYADNRPFQFEDRWIICDSVPDVVTADFTTISPNEWLVQKVPFTDVELAFLASSADQSVAEFLDVALGDPIFTAERITWLKDRPVTFARMFFAAGYRMTARL